MGAVHNHCSINYFANRYLLVVIHNFKGYNNHLIISNNFFVVEGSYDSIITLIIHLNLIIKFIDDSWRAFK